MALISVPTIDNIIFQRYFECVWNMECDQDWSHNYERKKLIDEIITQCGYDKSVGFLMLTKAHDIIYDRTYD